VITVSSEGELSPLLFPPDVFLTIVNVVQVLMGIIWIVDDQSTTQPITILVLEVAVIPVCALKKQGNELEIPYDTRKGKYSLFRDFKVIQK
jgi:hypothetical protein